MLISVFTNNLIPSDQPLGDIRIDEIENLIESHSSLMKELKRLFSDDDYARKIHRQLESRTNKQTKKTLAKLLMSI